MDSFQIIVNSRTVEPFIGKEAFDKKTIYTNICATPREIYHFLTNQDKSGIGIELSKDSSNIPYLMFVNCIIFACQLRE